MMVEPLLLCMLYHLVTSPDLSLKINGSSKFRTRDDDEMSALENQRELEGSITNGSRAKEELKRR